MFFALSQTRSPSLNGLNFDWILCAINAWASSYATSTLLLCWFSCFNYSDKEGILVFSIICGIAHGWYPSNSENSVCFITE